METILRSYNVIDSQYLLNLILDSKDKDLIPRLNESEIALRDNSFEQGDIFSIEQFNIILRYYKQQIDDYSVDAIPWDKFIGFNGKNVDINHMSFELLRFMLNINKDELASLLKEQKPISDINVVFSPQDAKILDTFKVKIFVPIVKCRVNINVFDKAATASFIYDLVKKEARDVNIITKY
jgi:hypothetical protein